LDHQATRAAAPAMNPEPLLPALRGAPDPMETVPAFVRNALPGPPEGLLPYYPRGGAAEQALPPSPVQSPPMVGPASPETIVRQAPYAQLMQALENPMTIARIRTAVLGELQRRGI